LKPLFFHGRKLPQLLFQPKACSPFPPQASNFQLIHPFAVSFRSVCGFDNARPNQFIYLASPAQKVISKNLARLFHYSSIPHKVRRFSIVLNSELFKCFNYFLRAAGILACAFLKRCVKLTLK
jgi:hypothetical protein